MRIEPEGAYFMPVSFGQIWRTKAGVFEDVLSLSTSYTTDKDALAALLPEPFEPADEPVVTVYCQQCRKVNILAGGGYNLMGLDLAAFFNGKEDQVSGNYCLIIWENDTTPIIRGRELMGVPKVFGDIPDPSRIGDDWLMQTSEHGRLLLEMKIRDVTHLGSDAIQRLNASQNEKPWLTWRHFPMVNGFGAAVSEAVLIGREMTVTEAWEGSGSVRYGDVTRESNPANADIVAALKTLGVKEYVGSMRTQGSVTITRTLNRVLR